LRAAGLEPAIVINNPASVCSAKPPNSTAPSNYAIIDLYIRALTDLSLRWLDSITRNAAAISQRRLHRRLFCPARAWRSITPAKPMWSRSHEALHEELKDDGVRVCALCPGPVQTEFFRAGRRAARLFSGLSQPHGRTGGARRL